MSRDRLVIGLISGTSVDAIDAALVRLTEVDGGTRRQIEVVATSETPFPAPLRREIFALFPPHRGSVATLATLDTRVGEAFAQAALALLRQARIAPEAVDLIGSHGQTVYHATRSLSEQAAGRRRLGGPGIEPAPPKQRRAHLPVTVQIGSGPTIAARTGITTVYDFRRADLALGGQGAPLVPYVDLLLFGDRRSLAIQNLGGIGNVTVIQRERGADGLFAFDTGPANLLIDAVAAHASQGRQAYDHNGALAAAGQLHEALLAELLTHPYFALQPPKSTGREEFGQPYAAAVIARGRAIGLNDADLAATVTAFTAHSIADAYRRFVTPLTPLEAVLLGGGGARNPTLRRLLTTALAPLPVTLTDDWGLPSDAKEAIAFAVLAYETAHGRIGALPTTTGARCPAILGSIAPGRGFRLWPDEAGR